MADRKAELTALEDDPLWYKDSVIYELHVKAFRDSDGDGIGDFKGLIEKLDYLHDLGVGAIWLLPFCPSPLKDDGYDISYYRGIHPSYGTIRDFRAFLREAHRRGLRVITELVVNHTSDQHPWYQRARRARRGSRWRDFYVWSETPDRYKEARIIFKDFESSNWTWDPVAKAYYWHRFYSHQPDLNYDNPEVQRAILRVIDFWFQTGVDGLRLDAVPYLYEREGTNCENLAETYDFLKKLRAHVDERFTNRMILAEANQWPEDAVAYFGDDDACHMAFHFPLMPRLFMALRMEDRFPIIDILEQTPAIPDSCQWALFLRNHDELTLEMVTDEERDYMYRVYAQDSQMRINLGIRRRLAPLLGNDRKRIEIMHGLLYSLPGTPVIYYGDEIGMGDNVYLGDRNGVRTPMQWSSDRNAGFSSSSPQKLYLPVIIEPEYHFDAINVEAQQSNPHSLLWWMKRIIAMRKQHKAFGRGSIEFLHPENRKILAFIRCHDDECILVVANLSRFVQYVELDLHAYKGMVPVELFGQTEFPQIGDLPYLLTLGPHTFYWFSLRPQRVATENIDVSTYVSRLPSLSIAGEWQTVFRGRQKAALQATLPDYLQVCRWFGGKGRPLKAVTVKDALPMPGDLHPAYFVFLNVDYLDGDAETYLLPLTFAEGEQAEKLMEEAPFSVVARLETKDGKTSGILYDAVADKGFCEALLQAITKRRRRKDTEGEIVAASTPLLRRILRSGESPLEPSVMRAEQSNTSVVFGERLILKLIRRLEPGINPDLQIGKFLTQKKFEHIPPVAGHIELGRRRAEPVTLAILHGYVSNQGDAWEYTKDVLNQTFENVLAHRVDKLDVPERAFMDLIQEDPSDNVIELVGPYGRSAYLLGQRTAELHLALATDKEDSDFAPESFTKLYQRSLYQSFRSLTGKVCQLLRRRMKHLPEGLRDEAQSVLAAETDILERFQRVLEKKITAMRIRCHGDYHLGQVLYTGNDFVIIDFEGEPARPLSERRIKRSPLRDVAGMLRSFHYAAYSALYQLRDSGILREEDFEYLEHVAGAWHAWVCVAFLKSYMSFAARDGFLPTEKEEVKMLLDTYLLEKSIYELGYELNNRPDWVKIPLRGIQQLLQTEG